ncbi:MAG: hypothetical protein IPQ07_02875 [Myxococcales bacterium]|nr:hypothetical protein [Myxococcales bacterium]
MTRGAFAHRPKRSRRALLVMVVTLGLTALSTGVATADPDADADLAFRRAGELATRSDPAAIAAFEALGAARPITRWTDDAWAEAARLAEGARDFARARRDLAQVISLSTDDRMIARARGALARIAEQGGAEWDVVRAAHERLASEIYGGGDPRPALRELEILVHANPTYPRANPARLAIALGWESEGDRESALTWFREAAEAARMERGQHARLEYVRALIRAGQLADADRELAALDPGLVDRGGAAQAAEALATAHHRSRVRIGLALMLVILLALALVVARREMPSWRAVARRLARPPIEVWFLAPLVLLLVVVALPGNPLVARAVRWIGGAGLAIAWLSGALLEVARTRGPLGGRRTLVHAVLVIGVVGTAAYLVVDGLGLLDLLGETWRGGPAMD